MTMTWRGTFINNPWESIDRPSVADVMHARRVDPDIPWHFFWARDVDNRVILTLRHSEASSPQYPLPNLRGVEVSLSQTDNSGSRTLVFALTDQNQQHIFLSLCLDIVSAASTAATEAEAVSTVLLRTWRWHHLLRSGGDGKLTMQEQMGILGEMFVLEHILLPSLGSSDAVAAWRGPLGSPKDFEIGLVHVESKAHRAGATPKITITSENQLDASGLDALFLHVLELNQATGHDENAVSVRDVADRIIGQLYNQSPPTAGLFETRLLAAGLDPEDDYSDIQWSEGDANVYLVNDEFPRITWGELRTGVSDVRYSISLAECARFKTSVHALADFLEGKQI